MLSVRLHHGKLLLLISLQIPPYLFRKKRKMQELGSLLLDHKLVLRRSKQKDPVKLTFILEPAPGSGLKEMPEG
jgi:hypothetical protein